MALGARLPLAGTLQPSLGVLAHHFQHAEANGVTGRVGRHQGLVDETAESVDDFARGDHLGGSVDIEATGEHGQSPEGDPLVVEQQIVAPVEGGGERLLAIRMPRAAT